MFHLISGVTAYIPQYSLSRQISVVKFSLATNHVCFLWPPKITMVLTNVASAFLVKLAFLKTYVCLSKVLTLRVMFVLSGVQKPPKWLAMFGLLFWPTVYINPILISRQSHHILPQPFYSNHREKRKMCVLSGFQIGHDHAYIGSAFLTHWTS